MRTPMADLHRGSLICSLLTAALAVVLSAASAQARSKKKPVEDPVAKELRFKEGDELGNELKAVKTEMLVMKSEKRALAQLLTLQKKYAGTPMEPEVLFRLAEIYMRRARTQRFFEVHRESEQVMSFVPTLVKQASEAAEVRKAVGIYDGLQAKFPNWRNMDIVLFNTAYAKQQLGEEKAAEVYYRRIFTDYPNSNLVPDSYLSVGEIDYNRREFAKALESFKMVKKFPQARVYPYGMYKAAWCHYNMQNAPAAIHELESVVSFGKMIAEQKKDAKLDLRKEALGDLATFYGEVHPSSKAVDYFLKQAEGLDAAPILLRVAELYNRHGRFNDVETVLSDLLKRIPESESAATVHEELVWNYERMRLRPKAIAQLTAMNAYCKELPKPAKAAKPAKTNEPAAADRSADCLAKIADVSKKLATKWHALWKGKQPTEELAASSEQAYKLYLDLYVDNNAVAADPDLAKIRFSYAEILFQRKKYREASAQYALVQNSNPDPTVSHDAAYAAVVSLEKAVDNKWNDQDEKIFVTLSDTYLTKFPKGQWSLDLQFKRAFIAYEKERYDEAAPALKKIGWENPITEQNKERVLKAQDLYLDILNVKKDYTTLKQAADSLVKKGIHDGARLTAVEKIYREAYFAEIQQQEEKGNMKGAIDAYKRFAIENKTAELAAKAWWNASQLEFKMGDAQAGANTCYQMHKIFPNSPSGKECLMKAVQTFEASGRLDAAARVLLNLALADEKQANKWRELSADFFALSGGRDRAKQMYLKLAEAEKPAKQLPYFEKVAQLEKLDQNSVGYKKMQAKIIALGIEPQMSGMLIEQAEEMFDKRNLTEAFNLSKKVLGRSLPKEIQARARFLQGRVLEDEYFKQSVKTRVDKIAMVLAIKTEKLEKAQKAYQETIKYGDPKMSIAALRRLADCYLHYSQAVRAMPLPQNLPENDLQALKAELDGLVVPMEDKGIDTLSQALDAARKFSMHDGSIVEIQNAINQVNMKKAGFVDVSVPTIVLPNISGSTSTKEVGT